MNQMICDEAEGCRRFAGEFPWSMSDFKPGDKECRHSRAANAREQPRVTVGKCVCECAYNREIVRRRDCQYPETLIKESSGFLYAAGCDTPGGVEKKNQGIPANMPP